MDAVHILIVSFFKIYFNIASFHGDEDLSVGLLGCAAV
jgi:hypothetical protein